MFSVVGGELSYWSLPGSGNWGIAGAVLQSEAVVESESKDAQIIKPSVFTSSEEPRQELGSHKHILILWLCSVCVPVTRN